MSSPRTANLEQVPLHFTNDALFRADFLGLTKIFQKVEEETEKRALAAELRASSRQQNHSRAASPHLTPMSSIATLNSANSNRRDRERRRGSVSISRFGQVSFVYNCILVLSLTCLSWSLRSLFLWPFLDQVPKTHVSVLAPYTASHRYLK